MEYKIHKTDLQNDLLVETLQALAECYSQINSELYVVGAAARDLAFRLLQISNAPRRTLDLDVAVLLSDWQQFETLTGILLDRHFVKGKEKQRFVYKAENGHPGYEVDVVPFGALADNEYIAWPPEGSPVMSVRCFDDVMRMADKVVVEDMFSFRMASLSGQFLIKLDAWQDRHLKTKKDAMDMVYILQNVYIAYALASQSLPPEIDINAEQFDTLVAGAEWIAADLKYILSAEHRQYYADMLVSEINKEENSELVNDMLDISDTRKYMLYRRALLRMAQILK
jgi:predicted nucleotidyltransferase